MCLATRHVSDVACLGDDDFAVGEQLEGAALNEENFLFVAVNMGRWTRALGYLGGSENEASIGFVAAQQKDAVFTGAVGYGQFGKTGNAGPGLSEQGRS